MKHFSNQIQSCPIEQKKSWSKKSNAQKVSDKLWRWGRKIAKITEKDGLVCLAKDNMIHCFDSRFVQEGTASENTTEDETEISEEKTKLKPSTSKISTIKKTSLTKKITHSVNRSI